MSANINQVAIAHRQILEGVTATLPCTLPTGNFPMGYYLTGPIDVGSEIILVYSVGHVAYFLTLTADGKTLVFDPRYKDDEGNVIQALSLTIGQGSSDSLYQLFFSQNQVTMFLGVSSEQASCSNLIVPSTTAVDFALTSTDVNPWPSVPFLARINYIFTTADNSPVNWYTYTSTGTTCGTGKATGVDSGAGGPILSCYNQTQGVRAVINPWYNSITCTKTGADNIDSLTVVQIIESLWAGTGTAPQGFTTLSDCNIGNKYSYCPPNSVCGAGNCRGPCETTQGKDLSCNFSSSSGLYSCGKPIIATIEEPFYQNPWFIFGMVVVGIIFVLLVILLIVRFDKQPSDPMDHLHAASAGATVK